VSWPEVGISFMIYLILGIVYALCHKNFYRISSEGSTVNHAGHSIIFWDFMFYALLGILVTFAVRIVGVLLIFGFLIVPAVVGSLMAQSFAKRLAIGWFVGAFVSFFGSYLSYQFDFPTGATVVVTLGIGLFIVAFTKLLFLMKRESQVTVQMH
jgi:zinc/manganese transport system permease protein